MILALDLPIGGRTGFSLSVVVALAHVRNKRCPKASIVGQCLDRTADRYCTLGILTPNIDKLISVAFEGARAIPRVDASLFLKQLFEVKITPNKAVLLWRSYGCEGKGAGLQTRSRRSPFLLLPVSEGVVTPLGGWTPRSIHPRVFGPGGPPGCEWTPPVVNGPP